MTGMSINMPTRWITRMKAGLVVFAMTCVLPVLWPIPAAAERPGIAMSGVAGDGRSLYEAPGSSFTNALGMTFIYIEPGNFIMGSPSNEAGRDEDEIQHQVALPKGFYLQTTEVTQGQWQAIMGNNPAHFLKCGNNCPVERVSLEMVQVFIRRLNSMSSSRRYRLPTEDEWEYACRSCSRAAFANGDIKRTGCGHDPNLDKMGWYCGNSGKTTHPVAQKYPNSWGLFDMHGNVFEWTADWYGNYQFGSGTDPTGPVQGWVIRGGSWNSYARFCRSASRSRYSPDFCNRYTGFRLAAE